MSDIQYIHEGWVTNYFSPFHNFTLKTKTHPYFTFVVCFSKVAILVCVQNLSQGIWNVPSLHPGSCLTAVHRAVAQTDPAGVLPLGRQHSLLNVITVVMDKLGHLVHVYLPKVLQILLCVTASVSNLLDQRDQVTRRRRRLVSSSQLLY